MKHGDMGRKKRLGVINGNRNTELHIQICLPICDYADDAIINCVVRLRRQYTSTSSVGRDLPFRLT